MSKMPCSISDDPYNDASDHYESEGVYKPNPDDPQYTDWLLKQIDESLKELDAND